VEYRTVQYNSTVKRSAVQCSAVRTYVYNTSHHCHTTLCAVPVSSAPFHVCAILPCTVHIGGSTVLFQQRALPLSLPLPTQEDAEPETTPKKPTGVMAPFKKQQPKNAPSPQAQAQAQAQGRVPSPAPSESGPWQAQPRSWGHTSWPPSPPGPAHPPRLPLPRPSTTPTPTPPPATTPTAPALGPPLTLAHALLTLALGQALGGAGAGSGAGAGRAGSACTPSTASLEAIPLEPELAEPAGGAPQAHRGHTPRQGSLPRRGGGQLAVRGYTR